MTKTRKQSKQKETPSLLAGSHYLGRQITLLGFSASLIETHESPKKALGLHTLFPIILSGRNGTKRYIAWPLHDQETEYWDNAWFAIDRVYNTPKDYLDAVKGRWEYLAENPERN